MTSSHSFSAESELRASDAAHEQGFRGLQIMHFARGAMNAFAGLANTPTGPRIAEWQAAGQVWAEFEMSREPDTAA